MINIRAAKVKEIRPVYNGMQLLEAQLEGDIVSAYAFPLLTGAIEVGDTVLLNTTAEDLQLGSGGYHFVMANLNFQVQAWEASRETGHIMKLRYTPLQFKVWAVEEPSHQAHQLLKSSTGLQNGLPVIAGSLHSMLIPCVCGLKAVKKDLKIGYVMTDGGALPLAMSRAVEALQAKGLLAGTITVGHAFGGDYEAVNLYSGILAAQEVLQAQAVIVIMGPGIVGTDTPWGTTALEVGEIINATAALGGRSYTIPRMSFQEQRQRHQGLSHHTITALEKIALASSTVVFPPLTGSRQECLEKQLSPALIKKHRLVWGQGGAGLKLAEELGLQLTSMGRTYLEDPEFFLAASACGELAAQELALN